MAEQMVHPKDAAPQALPKLYLGIVDFDSAIYRCSAVFEDDEGGFPSACKALVDFVQTNIVNPTESVVR